MATKYDDIQAKKRQDLIEKIHLKAEEGTLTTTSEELSAMDENLLRDYDDEEIPNDEAFKWSQKESGSTIP
jgi:hypothetical protein